MFVVTKGASSYKLIYNSNTKITPDNDVFYFCSNM